MLRVGRPGRKEVPTGPSHHRSSRLFTAPEQRSLADHPNGFSRHHQQRPRRFSSDADRVGINIDDARRPVQARHWRRINERA